MWKFHEIYCRRAAGIYARLGVRTVDEMVGRSDLLKAADRADEPHIGKVDLSAILDILHRQNTEGDL